MQTEITKKLFTVDEYYRMAEAGILAENIRTELIKGEVIEMSAMGARHAASVGRLTELLTPLFRGKASIRPQLPLHLNEFNEPLPDIALVKVRQDYYRARHPVPDDTLLAIEVSETSLAYDRDVKSGVYAAVRIQEFWVVDLAGDVLLVFRNPSKGEYQTCLTFKRGDSITSLAFQEISLQVSDLLG